MNPEEIAQMSGTDKFKGGHVGGSYYNTITLGKDGRFYKSFYSVAKDERPDPESLGDSVTATIIKVRGKLIQWENNQKALESIEYDAGVETVPTTKGDLSEKEAKELGAKKQLVVYALHDGDIAKITVSGGSLYNPNDDENLRLYSYLQSFEGDEHSFMVETEIKSIENEYEFDGETKTNYHMTFKAGKKSDLELVGAKLKELTEQLVDNDERDIKFLGFDKKAESQYEGGEAKEDEEEAPPF